VRYQAALHSAAQPDRFSGHTLLRGSYTSCGAFTQTDEVMITTQRLRSTATCGVECPAPRLKVGTTPHSVIVLSPSVNKRWAAETLSMAWRVFSDQIVIAITGTVPA
jgi:hypothetical protein